MRLQGINSTNTISFPEAIIYSWILKYWNLPINCIFVFIESWQSLLGETAPIIINTFFFCTHLNLNLPGQENISSSSNAFEVKKRDCWGDFFLEVFKIFKGEIFVSWQVLWCKNLLNVCTNLHVVTSHRDILPLWNITPSQ